jgi:hypothetical protein
MLTDIFGRNWAELTPILENGGDALREQADAISDNLVLTEENVKAAREFEIASDNLGDAVMGLKVSVGNALVPALTDLANGINEVITTEQALDEAMQASNLTAREKGMIQKNLALGGITLEEAIIQLKGVEEDAAEVTEDFGGKEEWLAQKLRETTGATDEQDQAIDTLSDGIIEVSDLLSKYTDELLFNKAAAGLDEEAALKLASAMGLVDDRAIEAMQAVEDLRDKYDLNKDGAIDASEATSKYVNAVRALQTAMNNLNDKTVTLTFVQQGGLPTVPSGNPTTHQKRHSGGPVTGGMPYIVKPNEEVFIPSQNGTVVPNNKLGGGNTYVLNVYTSAPAEPVIADFNMLRSLAGV